MKTGYKIFFQGAAWPLTALGCMGAVVRGDYWLVLIFGASTLALMWCGLSNAEKLP